MLRMVSVFALALAISSPSTAAPAKPVPADPLTVTVQTQDADRFVEIFERSGGKPTAAELQRDYLDRGSYGVKVFTPNRIESAEALAKHVAANPTKYRTAIDKCLPIVKQANGELRAIYLALRGLYPTRPLPQIYIVFGRGNSGGTAQPGAQVLGLEVLCEIAPSEAELRQTLRIMFGHETVHNWQPGNTGHEKNVLLRAVLSEGAADYIASLVLGSEPNAAREEFARSREAELWALFKRDVEATRDIDWNALQKSPVAQKAILRWINNYQNAPEGWPYELGYWIGMRIWQRYVDASPDKRRALDHVLTWTDPEEVLSKGAYRE